MVEVLDFLSDRLADSATGWSIGTFGAIAEFTRGADETAELCRSDRAISAVTVRGGLRVATHHELRLIASESPTSESWTHRVAFCLPEKSCAMSGRTELTEVGPDREALRAMDRAGVLFDLGLDTLQVDVCVRSSEPEVIAALRGCAGKSVFDPASRAMSVILAANPHRVFISRVGRAECTSPSRRRAARVRPGRILTFCLSYSRIVEPTLPPSPCQPAGSPARIAIHRIQCVMALAGVIHSGTSFTRRSN